MSRVPGLRVGFISRWDPADASAQSGMPASSWSALRAQGIELVHLSARPARRARGRRSARALVGRVPAAWRRRLRRRGEGTLEWLGRPFEARRMLREAAWAGRRLTERARHLELDALFGICVSSDLYALESDLPIVYATDATARLINTSYPAWARRSRRYHEACDELESRALARARAGLFASEATRQSAIRDYGFPPARAFVVPLGANLVPDRDDEGEAAPPGRDGVELAVVAADPVRKRVAFCIDVVETLAERGIPATLHYVGPRLRRASDSPRVRWYGPLSLSDAAERVALEGVFRRSHLLLLPSLAEMYGIAPCEAAHFGRPSVVTDVGGLPEVVQHERTGLVLPLSASASEFADAIAKLCEDPARYRRLARGARARAREELNWEAWGRRAAEVIRSAVTGERADGR